MAVSLDHALDQSQRYRLIGSDDLGRSQQHCHDDGEQVDGADGEDRQWDRPGQGPLRFVHFLGGIGDRFEAGEGVQGGHCAEYQTRDGAMAHLDDPEQRVRRRSVYTRGT